MYIKQDWLKNIMELSRFIFIEKTSNGIVYICTHARTRTHTVPRVYVPHVCMCVHMCLGSMIVPRSMVKVCELARICAIALQNGASLTK